jgi:hypothetical protein
MHSHACCVLGFLLLLTELLHASAAARRATARSFSNNKKLHFITQLFNSSRTQFNCPQPNKSITHVTIQVHICPKHRLQVLGKCFAQGNKQGLSAKEERKYLTRREIPIGKIATRLQPISFCLLPRSSNQTQGLDKAPASFGTSVSSFGPAIQV